MKRQLLLLASATLLLSGCLDVGDEDPPAAAPISAETPNSFLRYINTQASLAAGDYLIVAATASAGETGAYTLTVTHGDGTIETIDGSWLLSGGPDVDAPGNNSHALTMSQDGAVKIALTSAVDGYLLLVRAADNSIVAEDDNSGGGTDPLINLPLNGISSVAYADAYYDAVDPAGERSTLTGYLQKNCFIPGPNSAIDCAGETIGMGTHVIFRDSKDLGYGRNMHARRNTKGTVTTADDTFAFVVGNYVVKLQAGSSSNYGPINVEAAISEDSRYHGGTNAIEFTPDPNNPAQNIAKFFTFNKAGERITSADLDGRGVKHMPQMCWVCHGGRALPLDQNGEFPALALRSPKYNQLELDTFDYSSLAGWTRADQEANFRVLNEMVRDSYLQIAARGDDADKWFADFAIEIAEERYGGSAMASATYIEDYVPAGWQQTPSRPEGVEQLYKRVIEPHCVGCHALQGNNAGETYSGQPYAAAINFASWEKFNSYREIVADYVFRRGVMPLSLRNWEDFWRDPEDKPALLASFLADPTLFDGAGHVVRPGNPVARPGADRRSRSPVQLDGSASSFATTYAWSIVSPVLTTAELLNADTARPKLINAPDGVYVLSLTVTNANGSSDPEQVIVTVDSSMPAASSLTFVDDIAPILGSTNGTNCAGCHNSGGGYPGIPVYWDDTNPNLYRDVLMRVNRAAPELSLILVKPTGVRHGGGEYLNLALLADYAKYNTILEWIRAGAPCGVTTGSITCN